MKHISLELIDYQNNDPFPDQLTAVIESALTDIRNKKYKKNLDLLKKSSHVTDMMNLISKRFNMNIVLEPMLAEHLPAAIIPFEGDYLTSSDQFNRFSTDTFTSMFQAKGLFKTLRNIEGDRKKFRQELHNSKGSVNLKGARLAGYLSEAKHYLIVNFFALRGAGLDAREICAVILHEVGHAFTGAETHHKLVTTNSTIADILDHLNDNNVERAEYLYKQHFTSEDVKDAELENSKPIVNFYGKLARSYIGELNSQLMNSKYDETNFENLADSFAGRFNYGDALVTGLDKLHSKGLSTFEKGGGAVLYATLLIIEAFSWLFLMAMFFHATIFIMFILTIFFMGVKSDKMTYDNPKDRYNRIRNSIVNNLKNKHLPNKLTKELINQWLKITEIFESVINNKGLLESFSDIVSPTNRAMIRSIKTQQLVENNLNNLLFVKSAQVRVS